MPSWHKTRVNPKSMKRVGSVTGMLGYRTRLLSACLLLAPAAWGNNVVLHYNPRPPYLSVVDGQLVGLTGSPAAAAFRAAGVAVALVETPAARQLKVLEAGRGPDCAVGWFKNPQREAFAKFSKPIYRDQPPVALRLAGAEQPADGQPVESLLSSKTMVLLVKQSYSYGAGLDALIEQHQPKRISTTDESRLMLKSLVLRVADYMFMAPEEVGPTIAAAGFERVQFKVVKPGAMPAGEYRYILCSKQVPDTVMERLNAAIK